MPAPVIAEWWRGRSDSVTRDILLAVDVEPLLESTAKAAGEALAAVGGNNTIDALVVASAATRGDIVYTSDIDDLMQLAAHFRGVRILRV